MFLQQSISKWCQTKDKQNLTEGSSTDLFRPLDHFEKTLRPVAAERPSANKSTPTAIFILCSIWKGIIGSPTGCHRSIPTGPRPEFSLGAVVLT